MIKKRPNTRVLAVGLVLFIAGCELGGATLPPSGNVDEPITVVMDFLYDFAREALAAFVL